MPLFKNKNKNKNNGLLNSLKLKSEWFFPSEFHKILEREKNRSDRSGHPISFIYIDLTRYSKYEYKIPQEEYLNFYKKFLELIDKYTRDYDIKTLIDDYRIGVLLLDTSIDGAKLFIEKISKQIFNYFQTKEKEEYINIIQSIMISSYPVNVIQDCSNISGTPLILRNLKFEKKEMVGKNKLLLREKFSLHMNWNRVSYSNGALAISAFHFNGNIYHNINEKLYPFLKRITDIVGSLVGIIFFFPLMFLIALLIKLTSDGPILFKQKRLGYLGKPFTFLKFRTMYVDCDEKLHQEYVHKLIRGETDSTNFGSSQQPLFKLENDPRITRIGKYLRKLSLDELPQFFNVLWGDMSLVGPRPPIRYELEEYQNWHFRRILEVKPGITGLWQVYGRSMTTFDEMVRLDLQYIREKSILLDLKILLKTFDAVFNTKGAL